jgi:AcrR family transcriptional regulator
LLNAPSLRARRKLDTWNAIAAQGARLFASQGYDATTLDQIAAQAGVHKQTVLRYFRSKEDIALAYQSRALARFRERLKSPDRRESVIEYWRAHVRRSARGLMAIGGPAALQPIIDSDPRLLAHAAAIEHQYQDLIAAALSREAGVDPAGDVHAIALAGLLVGGNYAIARQVRALGGTADLETAVLSVVDFAARRFPPRV